MSAEIFLLIFLLLSFATGLWAWLQWRREMPILDEARTYAHGAAAAGILFVLLLSLDNEASGDGLRLLGFWLAIATGMLIFLQRQRLRRFSRPVMWAHVLCALWGLLSLGVAFV